MGVDARILIKITNPASWLNHKQLRQLSAQLTNVIGHDHFFLYPDEDRHALSFTIDENARYAEDEQVEVFDPKGPAVFYQDGDEIIAKPNEQFIECNVWSRYYGEGYARGDWKTLSFILMWCVYNIPDCEVWYGGDSSGICAEQMTAEKMQEMTKYYLTKGNADYWMNRKTPYRCEFCGCGVVNSGGGGDHAFWHCDSCGSEWVTKGGRTGFLTNASFDMTGMTVTKYDPHGQDREMRDGMASFGISEQISNGQRTMYPFDGVFRQKYPYVPAKKPKQLRASTPMLEAGEQ